MLFVENLCGKGRDCIFTRNIKLFYVQEIETFGLWCMKTVIYVHEYLNTSIHRVLRVEWKAPYKHELLLSKTNFLGLEFAENVSSFGL